MRYLSVCSGIEAATLAWEPLGFSPVGFAEIAKFPSRVLAHRWPQVPNFAHGGPCGRQDFESETFVVAHALRGEDFDASEDGTGRGTPIVPVCFCAKDHGGDAAFDLSPCLRSGGHVTGRAGGGVMPAIAFQCRGSNIDLGQDVTGTLGTTIDRVSGAPCLALSGETVSAVRRLTPTECHRLQGFPDDHASIPGAADGPVYQALGNSQAAPVMRWIGRRLAAADASSRSRA